MIIRVNMMMTVMLMMVMLKIMTAYDDDLHEDIYCMLCIDSANVFVTAPVDGVDDD